MRLPQAATRRRGRRASWAAPCSRPPRSLGLGRAEGRGSGGDDGAAARVRVRVCPAVAPRRCEYYLGAHVTCRGTRGSWCRRCGCAALTAPAAPPPMPGIRDPPGPRPHRSRYSPATWVIRARCCAVAGARPGEYKTALPRTTQCAAMPGCFSRESPIAARRSIPRVVHGGSVHARAGVQLEKATRGPSLPTCDAATV